MGRRTSSPRTGQHGSVILPSRAATEVTDPDPSPRDAGMWTTFTEDEARQLSMGDFNRPLARRQSAGDRATEISKVFGEAAGPEDRSATP